jgi:hypothetical protein
MTRIVRTTYRYKRPPRQEKPVALEVPAVVKATDPAKARKPASRQGRGVTPAPDNSGSAAPPAAAEQTSSVVTIRRKSRFGDVPELAPDEVRRRADLANDLFQDFKRQIATKLRKDNPSPQKDGQGT